MPSIIDEEIKNLQLDRPGRGKSADQLKRHTLQETFENKPIERALYLLTKGDEIQKISIIQQLPQLVLIDENATYTRILPKIQQELPTSSCEFHINASKIFQVFLTKPKAPPNLLTAVLQGIESRDLIVVNAWLETLVEVIPTLQEESIRKEILPIVLSKSNLTQPVMSRISASLIVGKIAIHPKFTHLDIKKDVLPIVQSLCQDVQPEVRATICQQLPNVATGLGEEFVKSHLLPCVVELASDNNTLVKSAAISATVCMLKVMTDETKKGTIVPLFKNLLENANSIDNITAGAIAKEIGQLITCLQPCLNVADITKFLQYYKTLARRGVSTRTGDAKFGDPSFDVMCRDRCASNLPAILEITVRFVADQTEQMYSIFRELASDPCYIVRRTVGSCVAKVALIMGAQNKMLKPDIVRLLRDDAEEVLQTVVPNIGQTMALFSKHEVISKIKTDQSTIEIGRALLKCQLELTKGYNWRLLVEYLKQLEKFCLYVPPEFIHTQFTPIVLSNALNGRALPIRSQALRTLLVFLYNNNKENQQKWLRESLISEFCYNNSSYTRRLFITLCSYAMDIFSASYFITYFYPPLIKLADDPVSNIRLMFANLLPQLIKVLSNDAKAKQNLTDITTRLETFEKNVDVLASLKGRNKVAPLGDRSRSPGGGILQQRPPVSVHTAPSKSITSNDSTYGSPKSLKDMKFLEQHFYTDAGINLPPVDSTNEGEKPLYSENITVDELTEHDIKALEEQSRNISDDVKVNLRNASKFIKTNSYEASASVSPAPTAEFSSSTSSGESREEENKSNGKSKVAVVNKRHSSVFSSSCLDNQTRKINNRRSLNIPVMMTSRIPVSKNGIVRQKSASNIPRFNAASKNQQEGKKSNNKKNDININTNTNAILLQEEESGGDSVLTETNKEDKDKDEDKEKENVLPFSPSSSPSPSSSTSSLLPILNPKCQSQHMPIKKNCTSGLPLYIGSSTRITSARRK